MQVTIPRKRGRPRKDGQSPASNLVRPTKPPVPATVEGLAPAVVRQKVAQAVAAGTLDAVALLHGAVLASRGKGPIYNDASGVGSVRCARRGAASTERRDYDRRRAADYSSEG